MLKKMMEVYRECSPYDYRPYEANRVVAVNTEEVAMAREVKEKFGENRVELTLKCGEKLVVLGRVEDLLGDEV